jgi:hypothetical protein
MFIKKKKIELILKFFCTSFIINKPESKKHESKRERKRCT